MNMATLADKVDAAYMSDLTEDSGFVGRDEYVAYEAEMSIEECVENDAENTSLFA